MGPGMMGNGPMNNQIRPNFMNMGGPRPGMNPNMCRPPMQQMGGPNNGGMNDGMMSGMGSPEMCGPNMQMGPGELNIKY